jgi:hypothetical protein
MSQGPKQQPPQYGGAGQAQQGQPRPRSTVFGDAAGVLPYLNPFTAPWAIGDKVFNGGRGVERAQDWINTQADSMGLGGPPPTPDYASAAEKTAQGNAANLAQQTAQNRPGQSTPFASTSWTVGPDGKPQQTTALAGGLGTAAGNLSQQIGGMGGVDFSSLPALNYGEEAGKRAYETTYGESARRLDPAFNQREDALRTRLLNQGLDPNSQAARGAMSQLGQEREDAYSGARAQAFGQGQQAQQQAFGQSLAARGQSLSELIRGRQMPYEELAKLQGLTQMPDFQRAGLAEGPDYLRSLGMQDAADMGRYQANQQFWSDLAGGAGQAGSQTISSLLPLLLSGGSDARIKRAIRRLKTHLLPGVPLATWEYLAIPGRRWLGVIAQDLARVAPHLVFPGADGVLRVPFLPIEVTHG